MRTLRSSVGAATGFERGTKGMSEVQKPVLEHSPTEAKKQEVAEGILPESNGVVKKVTVRETDVAHGREVVRKFLVEVEPLAEWLTRDTFFPPHQSNCRRSPQT